MTEQGRETIAPLCECIKLSCGRRTIWHSLEDVFQPAFLFAFDYRCAGTTGNIVTKRLLIADTLGLGGRINHGSEFRLFLPEQKVVNDFIAAWNKVMNANCYA